MSPFQNPSKSAAVEPSPPTVSPISAQPPKTKAPTAAEICQASRPQPAAKARFTPQQTPSEYLAALRDHSLGDEMVETLAHGPPDREGTRWATQVRRRSHHGRS